MNMRDLIPWGRNHQATPSRYREEGDPFMTLHREMNRLFDDVFRSFDMAPFGALGRLAAWPSVEVVENDKDVRICAELPGLDEKDVEVLMGEGVLTIRGEKKSEVEDKERAFSERTYGRFERRIPLPWEVQEDKIDAAFRNGVLTVTLPKSAESRPQVKRIAINRGGEETKH
ncbi:Hsp20/alpha crystallin family protein [Microvirga arsenatis]|uniref:Hsp20 family protein n=1 Tax=Microvirga arsenatis TaxID=2692265 RepID=A0ABW9YUN4_9HYPH|nr:Hsp20/alpha crystallin family protein [Microvirga arsenatis]NBJ09302.1 Hsp20 family protein [Microvirga arsenatis]NBJ23840.1 Hsp20 family protein [Microvirga arsenatis]